MPGVILQPGQAADALEFFRRCYRFGPRLTAVRALDNADAGEEEHMLRVLAEYRTETTVLHVGDFLPSRALVVCGDQCAFGKPVQNAVAPSRQGLSATGPNRAVLAARLPGLAAVGRLQQVWLRPVLTLRL